MNDSIGSMIGWIRGHKYIFVTAVFLLILFFFDENNMIKHFYNQREIAELKEEIGELQLQIDDYNSRFRELHKDINVMEKVARERYGMHKEGEEIFIVE